MPGVVDKRGDTWRHPQAREGHVTTEQRLEGCVYKPRTPRTAGHPQRLEEAGRILSQNLQRDFGPTHTFMWSSGLWE